MQLLCVSFVRRWKRYFTTGFVPPPPRRWSPWCGLESPLHPAASSPTPEPSCNSTQSTKGGGIFPRTRFLTNHALPFWDWLHEIPLRALWLVAEYITHRRREDLTCARAETFKSIPQRKADFVEIRVGKERSLLEKVVPHFCLKDPTIKNKNVRFVNSL